MRLRPSSPGRDGPSRQRILLLLTVTAGWLCSCQSPPDSKAPSRAPTLSSGNPSIGDSTAMALAARQAYECLRREIDLSSPGPTDIHEIESLHTWSHLWAEAIGLSANDATAQSALRAHTERMRAIEQWMERRHNVVAPPALAAARYFRLSAEQAEAGTADIRNPTAGLPATLAAELRDNARTVCEGVDHRSEFFGFDWVSEFPPSGLVERHDWSGRWMDAELTLASDAAQRAEAAKSHLDRLKRWEKIIEARRALDAPPATHRTATYYRMCAEIKLLQVEYGNAPGRARAVEDLMRDTARKQVETCELLLAMWGPPIELLECLHDWSLRLAKLECSLANDQAVCREAFDGHARRMEKCAHQFAARQDVPASKLHAAEYFKLEAGAQAGVH